ncbi:hypothetical protein [Halobaculum lipolyticum]|uniref:Uncharacterized protein n=1 Tax=Halobaculum lipolyticum TaxID=3032001 RepID=A0ABD5WGT8_9EURY|nr:hypothetical protein [Halobaculum sp. DT31]
MSDDAPAEPVDEELTEELADPPSDLDEELDGAADELATLDPEIRDLIEAVRDDEGTLRVAVRYEGREIEPLFVRDDVRELFPPTELRQRMEELVLKGLGDPKRDAPLHDYGSLDATIRWYDEVLVASFPSGEWSGILFVFDRAEAPLVDLVGRYLDDD